MKQGMGNAFATMAAGGLQPLVEVFEEAFGHDPASPSAVCVGVAALSEWMPWSAQAQRLLDAADRQRISRKLREQDRGALVLAYALHRLFLARVLQLEPGEVPLRRDDAGRPCLGAMPGCTSLSHSGDAVAFAYSPLGVVGIDIEPRERSTGMADIAERVCHPDEYAALPAAAALRNEALLATWVRKEAFLKAAGVGLACEMDTFSAPEQVVLHTGAAGISDGTWVRLQAFGADPDSIVAIAAPPELKVDARCLTPRRANTHHALHASSARTDPFDPARPAMAGKALA